MEDRDKILDYAKPIKLPDDWSKNRKNFTQGYFNREIGRYKSAVPSEFQWAAEDKLINKNTYEELKCQLPDSPRSTFLMVFSPDGKKVASTHGNHNVYVTDLTTGKNVQTLSGHPRTPWCIAFHPSSNQILASGCLGGQVRVWDLHGGSEVWTAESQTVIASLAFHPVDRMLVIATYNELHFWDWSRPEPFAKCSTKSGREKVRYVSFDRLGNKLITGIANPVNVPSQWDRISMVNSQPPVTSTTTPTTSHNSTPSTTSAASQTPTDQRSLTSWYRNFMSRYNQLITMSRNTPTMDRGTDPMELDLRNNRSNAETNTNNPSPSTSNPESLHPSSPLRFKITRAECRSYRPLSVRSSNYSSVIRRLRTRSCLSSGSFPTTSTTITTTASTSISQSSVITTSPSVTSSLASSPHSSILHRCQFSLCPAAPSWCLTLGPENTNLLSSRNSSQPSSSGAVTNPTYTSNSESGISSSREVTSNTSERPQISMVRHRLFFDDAEEGRFLRRHSDREDSGFSRGHFERRLISLEHRERLGLPRQNAVVSPDRSPNRDATSGSPGEGEIERELQRSIPRFYLRRQESESSNSSSVSAESLSSILQLTPEDSRNVSPRRFREEANSDGELASSSRRDNRSVSQSLMHPIPLPRFQVRSRLVPDQQSQLHLLTNRETHGLNLQHNQNLRRQLSFRPGGQFVLSRHSNSPFQPRVPHQMDSHAQVNSPAVVKSNSKNLRPEIPSLRSSFTTSASTSALDSSLPTTSSAGTSTTVASNLSFTGEGTSRQVPEQINRRLFDRVKMLLRDRIRNSSENASADSTVNYSRISGESEDPTHLLDTSLESEEGNEARGLGPRGTDPMLSSTSENLDASNETLLLPNAAAAGNGSSNLNLSQSELLDPWESETDTVPFSLNSPLSMLHDILSDQPQPAQESRSHEATETAEQNPTTSSSNNEADLLNSSSPEFSMRQGIQLLSHHIENLQQLCLARMEILHFQKIRRMWENLTRQIHYFHNAIQNRSSIETTGAPAEASNSGGDISRLRNLAINNSPVPEPSAPPSSEMDLPDDAQANGLQPPAQASAEPLRNKKPDSNDGDAAPESSAGHSSRNETEEPQPGPSGLSASNTSRNVRNSILHLEYRVYRLVRDIIQETRRRRDLKEPRGTSSVLQRQNFFRIRNTLRMKFSSRRVNRNVPECVSRFITRSREMRPKPTSKNEKLPKPSQPIPSTSTEDLSQPSTSAPKSSNEACQSCGQKKKPVKEFCRQKKRSVDSISGPDVPGSSSKALKKNTGERSVAPNSEIPEENPSTSQESTATSSESQDTSPNELLKHMLETMETMLRFQRDAFRRTKELTGGRAPRQQNRPPGRSSGDDSDSDRNDSNEQIEEFMKDLHRAKRLLGFMVRSLNRFFGENFSNLNQALDEQIFSLYMLLDLALELTDLLLDHLNARSRDLERSWMAETPESNVPEDREGRGSLPRTPTTASRIRERSRHFGRTPHNPSYGGREDYLRYKMSFTPLLPPFSRLISTRLNTTGSSSSPGRVPSSLLSSYNRRKRRPQRMPTFVQNGWYTRGNRSSHSAAGPSIGSRTVNTSPMSSHYRSFRHDRRSIRDQPSSARLRAFDYEINNNSSNNDTNNNSNLNDNRNSNSSSSSSSNNNNSNSSNNNNNNDNSRNSSNHNSNNNNLNDIINYYFPNSNSNHSSDNFIIVTGMSTGGEIPNSSNVPRNSNTESSNIGQSLSNALLNQNPRPLTLSRNESGESGLRDERPIFWIRYGGNNESSGIANSSDIQSRVGSFTVPVVHVNDVPVSDVSMLNQPRHRPQSPVPRVPEDIWRWRAWRPRFLHPRYGGPNPFDDQDSNDVPENIHYYRILSTGSGSLLGVHTLDPMIITDAPLSPHHRIQAWDFSKMNIPDISDREANGVVPECKIHNDASVDVSNDGHLLVTLLPSGRLSVTTMLGVYSLDWSSLGQLLYRTSFEQNAVSVSLSPTNRHLLVGLASRPVVVRDRTNMAQIFRLEGGRPSPHGGSWQSGRGRLVHMRDLEQTREPNTMSLNCIRWAPGAGQGLVYGTNTGQLKVLR